MSDTTAPLLTISGLPRTVKRAKFLRGLTFSVTPNEPATFEIALLVDAQRATIAVFNLLLAERGLALGAGKRTVRLKPNRRLIGSKQKFTVQVRVRARDAAGNLRTVTRKLRVSP